jgi:hypothetical protein
MTEANGGRMADAICSIEVVEIATGKVVKVVDVAGRSQSQIEKIDMGLLRNMDLDRYSTRFSTEPQP